MIEQEELNKRILELLSKILEPRTTFLSTNDKLNAHKEVIALKKDRSIVLTAKEQELDK